MRSAISKATRRGYSISTQYGPNPCIACGSCFFVQQSTHASANRSIVATLFTNRDFTWRITVLILNLETIMKSIPRSSAKESKASRSPGWPAWVPRTTAPRSRALVLVWLDLLPLGPNARTLKTHRRELPIRHRDRRPHIVEQSAKSVGVAIERT